MKTYSHIKAIQFEDVIKGPLVACNKAQVNVLENTRRLLESKFWEPDGNGSFTPVYVEFYFRQDGIVQRMRVPLMSLIPVPSLQLEDILIHFQAQVDEFTENKVTVRMLGENVDRMTSSEAHSFLDIKLRAGVSDIPMGLARLYQLFGEQLTSVTIEEDV